MNENATTALAPALRDCAARMCQVHGASTVVAGMLAMAEATESSGAGEVLKAFSRFGAPDPESTPSPNSWRDVAREVRRQPLKVKLTFALFLVFICLSVSARCGAKPRQAALPPAAVPLAAAVDDAGRVVGDAVTKPSAAPVSTAAPPEPRK